MMKIVAALLFSVHTVFLSYSVLLYKSIIRHIRLGKPLVNHACDIKVLDV